MMQHLLLKVIPPTALTLRLPAFLFGVLGVWATWRLARRAFGTTAGLVAAALVALSPWHLYASQFARYWTLVGIVNGWPQTQVPEPEALVDAWEWYARALRAHADVG